MVDRWSRRGGSKPVSARGEAAKQSKKERTTEVPPEKDTNVSLEAQQKCLDIFRDALKPSTEDAGVLQEVKGHLFNRDFATAFGKDEYLRVYASRWSPSRALGYLEVFTDLSNHMQSTWEESLNVVCVGGGAGGEIVGLGAWFSELAREDHSIHIDLVDIADWQSVFEYLHAGLTTPPELSKYASQAKRDASKAWIPSDVLHSHFHQLDVLSSEAAKQEQLAQLLAKADIVTFMFTLNELYSASLSATQALLKRMTETMKAGSQLLVVDSPGSYSTVSLNGAEKKYPMQWLLDHTLLSAKTGRSDEVAEWEKVVDDESRWFRSSKELSYSITLEDMRFQMHLYRRVG